MKLLVLGLIVIIVIIAILIFLKVSFPKPAKPDPTANTKVKVNLNTPPVSKTLVNNYHIFETFNNCGPASLSMALSYYGVQKTQAELGQELRPHQNPNGINDDKSVTLEELANKSSEYNLIPYHRPNGSIDMLKLLITYDLPIITRTWTKIDEDIGHYRVIKGFDDNTKQVIQDDSLQGKNLKFTYSEFDKLWQKFNYEFLVLVPKQKQEIVEQILGENKDEKASWAKAVKNSKKLLEENQDNIYARFNLSVAFFNTGEYQKSVDEYEKVEDKLAFRTLWYQLEPVKSYFQLGNYQRVFQITDKIFSNQNKGYSEAYLLRGYSYLKQNNKSAAKLEFEKAVLYNKFLKEAQFALNSINET